jgi:hypothetical protein
MSKTPVLQIRNFLDSSDPDPELRIRIRDGKKSVPESGINIPDPQHCPVPEKRHGFHFPAPDPILSAFCTSKLRQNFYLKLGKFKQDIFSFDHCPVKE